MKSLRPKFLMKGIRQKRILIKTMFYSKIYVSAYPEQLDKPNGKTVLVLSPHCDDDTFGCGGTLYKHSQAGDKVISIYLKVVDKIIQEEAKIAGKILGIREQVFCENKVIGLDAENRITELLNEIRPEVVYTPHPMDNHPDHYTTVLILCRALKKVKLNPIILCYEIWTPILPNIVVDITNSIEYKRKAIECFSSQHKIINYTQGIIGLNQYRVLSLKRKGLFAESFLKLNKKELSFLLRIGR